MPPKTANPRATRSQPNETSDTDENSATDDLDIDTVPSSTSTIIQQQKNDDEEEETIIIQPKHQSRFNALTKLYTTRDQSQHHIDFLTTSIFAGRTPKGLKKKITAQIPNPDITFMLDWEQAHIDFGMKLTETLQKFWTRHQSNIDTLINDISLHLETSAPTKEFKFIKTKAQEIADINNSNRIKNKEKIWANQDGSNPGKSTGNRKTLRKGKKSNN